MSLKVRHLTIRAQTADGLYGVSIPFQDGLCVLRAPNSSGKSTCLQAIVYALGLEGMLSAAHQVPLPRAVTDALAIDGAEIPVLESSVLLEIENGSAEALTIQRSVKGGADRRLVNVWSGPALSQPGGGYERSDYYVRASGSATREAGFHTFLAGFLGWNLPNVGRFDGAPVPLYLECLFPLLIVEQKKGWSVLPARFPQYLGIRDVGKRAVEFILNLDAYRNAERRRALQERSAAAKARWSMLQNDVTRILVPLNATAQNLPAAPTASWPPAIAVRVLIYREGNWIVVEDALRTDRQKLQEIESRGIPRLQEVVTQTEAALEQAQQILAERELALQSAHEQLQAESHQLENVKQRLRALIEDLQKYQDVRRLRGFGSQIELGVTENTCPTCRQEISDSLVLQESTRQPMTAEENIAFLQAQIELFRAMEIESTRLVNLKQREVSALANESNAQRERIRSIRQTLVADGRLPSAEAIEERIRISQEIRQIERVMQTFEDVLVDFEELSLEWIAIQAEMQSLPSGDLSGDDETKLAHLERLFTEQLASYRLSSVAPGSMQISRESYKPIHEGFDIEFNNSASDLIRTHWAYLNGMLEVGRTTAIQHPGLLILDEPGQQSIEWEDFRTFLLRAAVSKSFNQQVIVATSELSTRIQGALRDTDYSYVSFENKILQRLSE